MDLIFWWMPLAWLLVVGAVIAGLFLVRRRRGAGPRTGRPIAHSDRLTELPDYRTALARYRAVLTVAAASAVLLLVASVTLASRPAATTVVYPQLNNRDIVLCLDVSGSMIEYDAEIVEVFAELAEEFDGERVSLVVFNASAVTYFPLTSDYRYIADRLGEIREEFESDEAGYFAGTFFGEGSSLIGDGLAACSLRFDNPEQERSRSIILATDNLVVGDATFSLSEAGELATEKGIRVYGINPGDRGSKDYLDDLAREFERVVTATGGAYYALASPDAIPSIVESISSEQAAVTRGAAQLVDADQPTVPLVLAFLALGALLVFAWRLRR